MGKTNLSNFDKLLGKHVVIFIAKFTRLYFTILKEPSSMQVLATYPFTLLHSTIKANAYVIPNGMYPNNNYHITSRLDVHVKNICDE